MIGWHRQHGTAMRWLRLLILVIGWGGAAVLVFTAGSTPPGTDGSAVTGTLAPDDFKGYTRTVETFGGTIWVLAAKARRLLEAIPTEHLLAALLALGATLVAIGLRRAADPSDAADDDDGDDPADAGTPPASNQADARPPKNETDAIRKL